MDPNASYAIVTDYTAGSAARAEAALALLCWMADGGGGPDAVSDHDAIAVCHSAILVRLDTADVGGDL